MFFEKVQELIQQFELDGYFVHNVVDVQYLTGVHFETEPTLVVPAHGNASLVISALDYQMATELVQDPMVEFIKVVAPKKTTEYLQEVITEMGGNKWGFDDSHLTVAAFEQLRNNFPNLELVAKKDVFVDARICKSPAEIEKMQKAAEISDAALQKVPELLSAGRTENSLAAELEYIMKEEGSQKPGFDTIIASGPRSWYPHGTATTRELEEGDIVTVDLGATWDGYRSDCTRTFIVGEYSQDAKDIINLVNETQKRGVETVEVGKTGKDVDEVCRNYLAEQGYGDDFFVHSTGHGVGLDVHEEPSISRLGERPLEEGMVITIEPGIYVPGKGGARTEDTLVVGASGPIILTKAPIIYY
ncbi:MAG TPA: Xaa-Pro peptidase family protein [Candidatus Lokiarchaeia archaeon]|nr:Xaa-Pro peptidase family protein [Candidatus Lokiarchaeia archaeon]